MKKICLIISIIWLVSSFVTPVILAEDLSGNETLISETDETPLAENVIDDTKEEESEQEEVISEEEICGSAEKNLSETLQIEAADVTEASHSYDGTTNPNTRTTFAKYNGSSTDVSGLDFFDNAQGLQNTENDVVYHVSGTSKVDDFNIYKYCFSKDLSKDNNFVGVSNYSYSIDVYFPTLTEENSRSEVVVAAGVNKSAPNAAFVVGAFDTTRTYNNSTIVIDGLENNKWYNIAFDISYNGLKNGDDNGSRLERNIYINGELVSKYYKWDNSKKIWTENTVMPVVSTSSNTYDTWNMVARPSLKYVVGEKHDFYFDNVIYKNTAYTQPQVPVIESAVYGVVTVDEGKTLTDIVALTTNANKTEIYRYNSTAKTYTAVTDAVATGDIVKLVSAGGAYNYYQVSVNAGAPVTPTPPVVSVPTVEGSVLVKDFDFELKTYDSDMKISAPLYKKGDAVLDGDINANDVIDISVSGTNEGSEKELYLVSALYDENNTMLCAGYDFIKKDGDFVISASLKAPSNLAKGKYNIKTFLWDNVDATYIYTDNFDISKNGGVNFASYGWNLTDYSFISSKDKYTGRNSLEIVSGTGSDKVVSQEVELEKNDIYKVVFASKGDAGFMYDVMDSGFASSLAGGAKTFEGNANWDLTSIVFESKENDKANLVFKQGNASSNAFVDNVVITKSLMSNGGFEGGKSGFTFDTNNDVVGTNALDGSNAGYIKSGKVAQTTNLIDGYDYKLVFYSKGAKVTAKILDDTNSEVAKKEFDASTTYKYNSINFKAPDGKTEFTVEFSAEGDTYIDCVSLEKKPLNLIENAEFKYGITDLWTISDKTRGTLSAVKDGDEYVLEFSNRTANWVRLEHNISDAINQSGSGKYKLSFDIKYMNKSDSNSKLEFYLFYTNDGKIYNAFTNITDEWTTIELEYDITDDMVFSNEKGNIAIGTGTGVTAGFMLKNVSLVKVN